MSEALKPLQGDEIRARLKVLDGIGRKILVFQETDSTNDLAAQAGRDGAAAGLTIFAESQRFGRGRLGRKWHSPPGVSLLMSILLRPEPPKDRWSELTLLVASCVSNTATHFTNLPTTIKEPNDVLLNGRKVCGILSESHVCQEGDFLVVGVGLNVLQKKGDFDERLTQPATSLSLETSQSLSREDVATRLLDCLQKKYSSWSANLKPTQEEQLRRA